MAPISTHDTDTNNSQFRWMWFLFKCLQPVVYQKPDEKLSDRGNNDNTVENVIEYHFDRSIIISYKIIDL